MIRGVDRSHHNSKVALASLASKGVKFIWFKATQGATYKDDSFNAAWQEAKAITGMCRGAYHFFDPQTDGVVQAKNLLSMSINFSGVGCLPPCIDVEDLVGSNVADTALKNKWVSDNWNLALGRLNNLLAYIKQETGRECIIYSYNNYMKQYLHGTKFPNNGMWLSSLQENCPVRYDTGKFPLFWQNTYSWNGTDMDGNYFIGSQNELNALANIKK